MSVNALKRLFTVLALSLGLGAQASAASNFPYPQNRNYSFGFKPTPFGGSAAADATTIQNKYNSWLSQKRVAVGGCGSPCYRIQAEDRGNDTVSEGISYGMLLAVYFDDQNTFNGLWNYKVSKNDGLGLMNWDINSGGGVVGSGSATDADTDIAYALYLANYQWGSSSPNYKSLADAEMTKIVAYNLDSNRIKPGDSFNDCRYPSYFFPNEYRVFAKEKTGDASAWNAVRNNCYSTIAAARNNTTGLVAEQCTDTGQGGGCSVSSSQYQYNSARVPLRMALDYVYYGDSNAQTELTKLASHFNSIAPGSVVDCYNLNGTPCSGGSSGAFVGPGGTAFMVNGAAPLQAYYNYLMVTDYSNNYFGGAISLLSLLLLSGNMPNIGDQASMFTPTKTPTITPYAGTPTVTPTQTPIAFAYVFEDFENAILVNSYNYTGPTTAANLSLSSGINSGANNTPGGGFSDRIQVVRGSTGQYAGHGFDSSYAPASGVLNFSGATSVRLAIKTDTALSFNISFREGNGVNGGDDEVWSSTTLAVASDTNWQIVSFPINTFTENAYNPSCAPNCGTSGNGVFNLSSIKALEIAFPSIIGPATANVYIDDIAFVPSIAPTMTPTKTPFPNPYNQIYDDFEAALSLNGGAPSRVTTYANTALSASAAWALDSTTYVAGSKAGRMNYNLGSTNGSYGGGGSFISPYGAGSFTSPYANMAGSYFDASGAVQMQLWLYAPAGLKYRLTFQEAGTPSTPVNGADGEGWYTGLLTGTGVWQRVTVDIGDFVEDPYNTICNPTSITAPGPCLSGGAAGNGVPNMNAIWQVGIKLPGEQMGVASRTGTVYFDDITFITNYKSPTITRTFTPGANSPTPTRTPSPSATRTATRTSTQTATRTTTPSDTRTATPSASPTRTLTPASSPSDSPTRSFTPSLTATRTATRTTTPTASPTDSPSVTRSATPSVTRSASPTISPSPTDVPVGSSPTSTPTISPTHSMTPTVTRTASPSATRTGTPTQTAGNTATDTPTATPSVTLGNTATRTPTPTTGSSATFTPVNTATFTPMNTLTVTPMSTATITSLNTATDTPVNTLTVTPMSTATITSLNTATTTPVNTATITPMNTATITPANSATLTWTRTPSPTLSPSPTQVVFTATRTPQIPTLGTVSPASGSDSGGFAVTIDGANYAVGAVIVLDGVDLLTNFNGPTQLSATVPAHAPGTLVIKVRNPDGSLSNDSSIVIAGPAPIPSATAVSGLPIIEAHPFPNPNPIELRVKLGLPADSVEVKVYTRAMTFVGAATTAGPLGPGWHRVSLPGEIGAAGGYFFKISATRNQSTYTMPGGGRFVKF